MNISKGYPMEIEVYLALTTPGSLLVDIFPKDNPPFVYKHEWRCWVDAEGNRSKGAIGANREIAMIVDGKPPQLVTITFNDQPVPERSERIDKIRKDKAVPLSEYNGQKFHERVIDAFYAASKVMGDQEKQIAVMEQRINELQGRITILESKFTN